MSKRISFLVAICVCGASLVYGRLVNDPGYKQMSEQSDLVVIATPTENADLPGTTTVPNVALTDKIGTSHAIPAKRVETTFRAVAVLKGKLADKATTFELLHLKYANPDDAKTAGAAQLIEFVAKDRSQYLMFLKLSGDGPYEPFNGQTDPIYSIEKLSELARPNEVH